MRLAGCFLDPNSQQHLERELYSERNLLTVLLKILMTRRFFACVRFQPMAYFLSYSKGCEAFEGL